MHAAAGEPGAGIADLRRRLDRRRARRGASATCSGDRWASIQRRQYELDVLATPPLGRAGTRR